MAYVILSHRLPDQVTRLVRRIRADRPHSIVVLHHDTSKSELPDDTFAGDPHVLRVTPSVTGRWGDFSVLEMQFRALETLVASARPYDWVTLLSGQDYPIKPLRDFESSLSGLADGAIIRELGSPEVSRYSFAWHRLPEFLENGYSQRLFGRLHAYNERQELMRFTNGRVGCRYAFRARRSPLPGGMCFFKGFQWWTLSRRCIEEARSFGRRHPKVLAWYRRTIIPDESYFQTVLYNNPSFSLRNEDGRYVRWDGDDPGSPATLSCSDIPALAASEAFFARKFDSTVDPAVLDEVDRRLLVDDGRSALQFAR